MKKWYDVLVQKAKSSYCQQLIIRDLDKLGNSRELLQVLEESFALILYHGELPLRQFIRQNQDKQIIILIQDDSSYLPFDIEAGSELMEWKLLDIFPYLDNTALHKFTVGNYQSIFETYKREESELPGILNKEQTLYHIKQWIKDGKVIAHELGFYDEPGSNTGSISGTDRWQVLNEPDNIAHKVEQLINKINEYLQTDKVDWPEIAFLWGQLEYLHPTETELAEEYYHLDSTICQRFEEFINKDYDKLIFASYKNGPVIINQTMNYLSTLENDRIALVCFDGMGFAEWCGLRDYLKRQQIYNFREKAVFAVLPTLTWSSRNALFSGEINHDKMQSEEKSFIRFVERYFNNGLNNRKKLFKNPEGKWNREYPDYNIVGMVINIIDDIAHNSMILKNSKATMHKQLNDIYPQTGIAQIISSLLAGGYRVFLTADHGSVWCKGNGIKADKYLVEDRAMRALLYPNEMLAREFASENDVITYKNTKILGDKVLILPRGRDMFYAADRLKISHGGIHIEEVIIPFVEVLP